MKTRISLLTLFMLVGLNVSAGQTIGPKKITQDLAKSPAVKGALLEAKGSLKTCKVTDVEIDPNSNFEVDYACGSSDRGVTAVKVSGSYNDTSPVLKSIAFEYFD